MVAAFQTRLDVFGIYMIIVCCQTWFNLLFSVIMNLATYQTHFCKINCILQYK